MCEELLKT